MTTSVVQFLILILGATVAFMVGSKSTRVRFWGFVLAVLHQPLWIFAAWEAGQWGQCLLAIWYTVSYARGVWNSRKI